ARNRLDQRIDWTERHPLIEHRLVPFDLLLALDTGLRAQQNEGLDARGREERGPERQVASLGHATYHGAFEAEVIEQTDAVGRRVPVGERAPILLGLAKAPLVPADQAELGGEHLDLTVEHALIHEEAVGEDHRGALAARVLEVDALTVDVREGHGAVRSRS